MDTSRTTRDERHDTGAVLASLVREGSRGARLRSQLASSFPDRPSEEIDDAVQGACSAFLAEAEGISDPGAIYSWVRTTAYHAILRGIERQGREHPVDPVELGRAAGPALEAGPAEKLIALEEETEISLLVREVAGSLSARRRRVLVLWATGRARPEIASLLGLSERAVKRDLLAIMEETRAVLAREEGGGCPVGEPLVTRLICGLTTVTEAARARSHMEHCGRCAGLAGRLEAWRDKAGAILPVPALEAADPGLLGRLAGHGAQAVGSLRHRLLGGATRVKEQASAGAGARAVDPTPLAGIRPGAVAAVVAGCIAVGGGATYCAQRGVDPLGTVGNLIAGTQEGEPPPIQEPTEATEPAPVVPPPTPVTEEAPVYQPSETSRPETTYTPEPRSEAEPEPEPEPQPEPEPTPEPEPEPQASFEPSAPVTAGPTEKEVVAEPATESAPTVKAKPTAAPGGDSPQFGGP